MAARIVSQKTRTTSRKPAAIKAARRPAAHPQVIRWPKGSHPAEGHTYYELLGMAGSIAPDGRAYHWREDTRTMVGACELEERGKPVTRERFDKLRYAPELAALKPAKAASETGVVSKYHPFEGQGWFDGVGSAWTDGTELLQIGARLGQVRISSDKKLTVPDGGPSLVSRMTEMASILLDDLAMVASLVDKVDKQNDPIEDWEVSEFARMTFRYTRMITTLIEARPEIEEATDVSTAKGG